MKRKLLTLLLAFCLVVTMMPAMTTGAFATVYSNMVLNIEAVKTGGLISSTKYQPDNNSYDVKLFDAFVESGDKWDWCYNSRLGDDTPINKNIYEAGTTYCLVFRYKAQGKDSFDRTAAGNPYVNIKINLDGKYVYTLRSMDSAGTAKTGADGEPLAYFDKNYMYIRVFLTTPGVALEKISISSDGGNVNGMTIYKEETKYLTATIYPANATNKDLTWTSSDPSVATITKSGKEGQAILKSLKAGPTTITVSAGGKKAHCYVSVLNQTEPVKITLDRNTLDLNAGESFTLKTTVTPASAASKAVTWKSSDATIATVSKDGVVTAVKAGTAKITASLEGKSAVCQINVKKTVTGVTLDKSSLEMEEGKTETLKATVEPADAINKEVIWKSSDTGIAAVSSEGIVTAVKAGTATITVATKDGSKSASCEIKVIKPVTGVALDKSSLKLGVGGSAILNATLTPADATNKSVTWKSSDAGIATVSSEGIVTAVKAGTATITVTTKDGSKSASCEITVVSGTGPAAPDSGIIDPVTGKEVYTTFNGSDMKLEYTTAAYNGSYREPEVYITNTAGASLTKGTDYTLDYYNNNAVGKATVIVRGMGAYEGVTAGIVFNIKPKSVTVKSLKKPASKKLTVKWASHKTQTTGFQVRYATTKSFKSGTYKTVTVNSKSATYKTLTKLKAGKKYYVKVRAYKTVDGKKIYSSWSKAKSAKA